MINGKANPAEILSDDLGRGSVVFVKWSARAEQGRHYTQSGEPAFELAHTVAPGLVCLAPNNEGSFTRPGYSDEEQYSEGVIRERVSRFWTIHRSKLDRIWNGPHRPTTLIAGVAEGKSTIARFAFAVCSDNPVVYYQGAGYGFVLEDQLLHHPALGRPLAITSAMEPPQHSHHKPAGIGIYTPDDARQLVPVR